MWSTFHSSVVSNSHLLWFCITTLIYWLKKVAPLFQPIRSKTKTKRKTHADFLHIWVLGLETPSKLSRLFGGTWTQTMCCSGHVWSNGLFKKVNEKKNVDGKRELYSVVASMHSYSGRPSLFHNQLRAFLLVLSYTGYPKKVNNIKQERPLYNRIGSPGLENHFNELL